MSGLKKKLGMDFGDITPLKDRKDIIRYINLKLTAMGQPAHIPEAGGRGDDYFQELFQDLIEDYKEKTRVLSDNLCPADKRIQGFIEDYFKDVDIGKPLALPGSTFILDQHGLARELSLPVEGNVFKSEIVESYRIKQGILHNPKHDRRTTKGSFHIADGGLPVPLDKKEVPKVTFAHILHAAVNPPRKYLQLPFTSNMDNKAEAFVSLLMRPLVSPEVKGVIPYKTMEVRFFVPGNLVSNLDFVESIFGNAGDPNLSINDAALDIEHWTGTTGCIILAPHLITLKKAEVGLPHFDNATERQRNDGMCWKDENELYNNGQPFKLTCRNEKGVIITLIGDNYYGYSKKETKTMMGFSANLFGSCEEEHAGGALAFPRINLGEFFHGNEIKEKLQYSFDEVKDQYSDIMDLKEEGYGIDKKYPGIYYMPEDFEVNLREAAISWVKEGETQKIKLLPNRFYVHPAGYKVHMEKDPDSLSWKLIRTSAEGAFLHKPCTVSGGGKSEISKSIENSIIYGSFYVSDFEKDMDKVEEIINYDYRYRWKSDPRRTRPSRPILSPKRSLGSVIKLLTKSPNYTDDFLKFLDSIPNYIKPLVFLVKRLYQSAWGTNWREHFSVNIINGFPGHELNFNNKQIRPSYLRVGFAPDGSWRIFKLRMDFAPSAKIQKEDDISVSITLPAEEFDYLDPEYDNKSIKFVENCEHRLFQRPDEAIIRGYDKQAEADLASKNVFVSNYQPLTPKDAREIVEDAIGFEEFTDPIKELILEGARDREDAYFISPSHPRIVNGAISKNPRYLQTRPDFVSPIDKYIAEVGVRFFRKVPLDKPVYLPVNAVLPGRRNNPPDKKEGIRPLSVFNPIHYQQLPELFMDFVCSLTGKSPSTTGAGSEGALTKGPFNALTPTTDLNNALLSYILTGYNGFSSAAGYIGNSRMDHDISILIPEIWCRMREDERDPENLIQEGAFEKLEDFEYNGKKVLAGRLGYRITSQFVYIYLCRIFDEPGAVFTEQILKPELQDLESYVDGINNIVEAQQRVAVRYFEDKSVESAIPPLQVLLHIMAYGNYEGKSIDAPELRKMFTRDYVLKSDWYKKRLELKQQKDIALYQRHIESLTNFIAKPINELIVEKMQIKEKLKKTKDELKHIQSKKYLDSLIGTIGADPLYKGPKST